MQRYLVLVRRLCSIDKLDVAVLAAVKKNCRLGSALCGLPSSVVSRNMGKLGILCAENWLFFLFIFFFSPYLFMVCRLKSNCRIKHKRYFLALEM